MPTMAARPTITAVQPLRAVQGGRVTIHGSGFRPDDLSSVTVGDQQGRIAFASARRLIVIVPDGLDGGRVPIKVAGASGETAYVQVGTEWATGLHQVDNPVFDGDGNLFVTYSGSRGQEAPVSIFRVTPGGTREPFASGIVNATSMAIGPDGFLYVSSRFVVEVYCIDAARAAAQVVSDPGVA